MTEQIKLGYWTTKDLMERYQVSRMTLHRWMNREENPLPSPKIKGGRSLNRWQINSVLAWENGESAA